MKKPELIARGVIVHDGKILLCRNVETGSYYFLPGGHIEEGESPEAALLREISEEIDRLVKKSKMVAEVKNTFTNQGGEVIETFYVFLVALDDYKNIKNMEDHLRFEWVSLSDFEKADFRPKQAVKNIFKDIEENKSFWI